MTIAILFARADSHYKAIDGCDVWDIERDARRWPGGCQVVAHPPCRAWGRLRHFANPRPDEKALALWAVEQVRRCGGVLEHPASSTLWPAAGLPAPGADADAWGGWTLPIVQQWWGHRAEKKTLLYIVGCAPSDLPAIPMTLGEASHVIQSRKRSDYRPHVTKAEREHTPPAGRVACRPCQTMRPNGANRMTPLENIRSRCHVDTITGCWLWRGATSASNGGMTKQPRLYSVDYTADPTGQTKTVQTGNRAAWHAASGRPIKPGHRVYKAEHCTNGLCVNPDHMACGSTDQWGKMVTSKGVWKDSHARIQANRAIGRKRSTVTPEAASEIRRSSETGVELSARLGIGRQVISRIRRGMQITQQTGNPFAGLMT